MQPALATPAFIRNAALTSAHRHGAAILLAVSALGGQTIAQTYPERPPKVVVPYAAGGNTDAIARLISERLSETLGKQFVVENHSGASGAIAMEMVKNAPPDGHTLLIGALPQMAILPAMVKVKYDPLKDYAPISNIAAGTTILVVANHVPARNVPEVVAWVKNSKEKLSYASAGPGGNINLAMLIFMQKTGIQLAPVHFRGGSEPVNNIVAGHIPTGFLNASDVIQQSKAATLRAIAVASRERFRPLPDVPTMAESGVDFTADSWNGLLAPAGTPAAIVEKLSREVQAAVKDSVFVSRLSGLGVIPIGNAPAAFAAELARDRINYEKTIVEAGLAPK